jgi:hypothetical protein
MYQTHLPDDQAAVERLRSVISAIRPPDVDERFDVLIHMQRWDLGDGELQRRLREVVDEIAAADRTQDLLTALDDQVPAAWELGYALATSPQVDTTVAEAGLTQRVRLNPAALAGFLAGQVDSGRAGAFDDFLQSSSGAGLDPALRLFITVRGPATPRSHDRVVELVQDLPVDQGAQLLFGWQANLSDADAEVILANWISRLSSQSEYNAAIDWLGLLLHGRRETTSALSNLIADLVLLRATYPNLGQQQWQWAQLAKRIVDAHAVDLIKVMFDAIEADGVMIFRDDPESQVLRQACSTSPRAAWEELIGRISRGAWRIQLQVQGWLLDTFPEGVVSEWIGEDVSRARLVATLTPVDSSAPSPIVRALLQRFGADERVAGSLRSQLVAGFWTGNESERLAKQITELKGWRQLDSPAASKWAQETAHLLDERRTAVLQSEAEERY